MALTKSRRALVALAGAAAITMPAAAQAAPTTEAAPKLTVVAKGLNNPRGLAVAADGTIYVAEAGKGGPSPCFPDPEDPTAQTCYGKTGSVTKIWNGQQTRIITGLSSLAGPDGSSAIGPSDISLFGLGYVSIGLGADPARRKDLPAGNTSGLLKAFTLGGPKAVSWTVADPTGYEAKANPDKGEKDSNPQAVLAGPNGLVVADAGGNDLIRVNGKSFTTLAVFPDRMVDAPPFLGLPPGTKIPMQAVPTNVVWHNGAYYVSQLTGFPFPVGAARIYKVVPGHAPQVYATGFTNAIDLAFAGDGTLYVLEIAHNSLLGDPPVGALMKVRPGKAPQVVLNNLNSPGGLVIQGKTAYFTDCSVCPGGGRVVKVQL